MQLKGFLLIGFVLNVFCLNNLSGEFLSPKYDLRKNESLLESLKRDPSSFVELFAKADPDKINEVIGLLEVLVDQASSALDLLDSHVNNATISLQTAMNDVVEANINVQTATTNKQTAQSALEQADIDHTSALNDQTIAVNEEEQAQSAKLLADQNYNEQSPSLLSEQQVIQDVIRILKELNGYQYYRMTVSQNGGADYWCIQELRFYGVDGSELVTDPSYGSAESEYPDYGAYHAFDEGEYAWDDTSYYCSAIGVTSGWLQYDFQNPVAISKYTVGDLAAHGEQYNPEAWTFEGSNDGSSWVRLDDQSGHVWGAGEVKEFTIAEIGQ